MATTVPVVDTRTVPVWLTAGDFDGFLGLFFSGLPDLLLIAGLGVVCGLPQSLMVGRILPGIAISILLGNLFYSWQAYGLAKRTGRTDVTAIPFGVNAPTIFAYIFLIMEPVYLRTHDPNLVWQVGVFACSAEWFRPPGPSAPTGCVGPRRGRLCSVRWRGSRSPSFVSGSSLASFNRRRSESFQWSSSSRCMRRN